VTVEDFIFGIVIGIMFGILDCLDKENYRTRYYSCPTYCGVDHKHLEKSVR
tara:strand:+ start:34 stop:186 length:153 start_codon:yes stop_codon:yes gene_type:complete